MAPQPDLSDLIATIDADAIKSALLEAYTRGVAAGRQQGQEALRASVLGALGEGLAPTTATSTAETAGSVVPGSEPVAPRAPRGLTREVIFAILTTEPGLTTPVIQSQALLLDDRVSPKTVYNELNRERGVLYEEVLGRWSLISKKMERALSTPDSSDNVNNMEDEDLLKM